MPQPRPAKLIDLTRKITHEMLNFPGEPRPGFIHFAGVPDIGSIRRFDRNLGRRGLRLPFRGVHDVLHFISAIATVRGKLAAP